MDENGPFFLNDFTINTSIYKGFSVAMLNNQLVSETDWNIIEVRDWNRAMFDDTRWQPR